MPPAVQTDRHLSREEFYRWAQEQPRGRFERIDGQVVAMAPEKGAHLRMKAAIWRALHQAVAVGTRGDPRPYREWGRSHLPLQRPQTRLI